MMGSLSRLAEGSLTGRIKFRPQLVADRTQGWCLLGVSEVAMGQSRRISRLWDVKLKGHKRRPGNEAEEVGPCPWVCVLQGYG